MNAAQKMQFEVNGNGSGPGMHLVQARPTDPKKLRRATKQPLIRKVISECLTGENSKLASYIRIAENLQLAADAEKYRVIGFVAPTRNQGTSMLMAITSVLLFGKMAGAELRFDASSSPSKNGDVRETTPSKHGVCLIDAQLRHPSLHKIFGVRNADGVAELLQSCDLDSVQPAMFFGAELMLLAAGRNLKHLPRPLPWQNMQPALTDLRARKKLIFIDIPPLLANPDSIRLCKMCDAVILTGRANKIKYEVINEARRQLEQAQVNILGGALTARRHFVPGWLYRKL